MADKRIDQLPADTAPLGTDLLYRERPSGPLDLATPIDSALALLPLVVGGLDVTAQTIDGVTYLAVESYFASLARPLFAQASSDSTISNDATVNDDAALFVTVPPNSFLSVRLHLLTTSATNADVRLGFSGPTGASFVWQGTAPFGTAAAATTSPDKGWKDSISNELNIGGIGSKAAALIGGILTTGADVTDPFRVRWSQFTAQLSNTTRHADSALVVRRLSLS